MIRQLKKITVRSVAAANVVVILLMMLVGYSDRINPADCALLSNLGLAFPAFVLANVGFLVFWLVFKVRMALIPFLGFVVCFVPMRKYCPFNIQREIPAGSIKILSYNVWLFAGWDAKEEDRNEILEYIVKTNADIVCLQEAAPNEVGQEKLDKYLNPVYSYRDTAYSSANKQGDCIALYSKYPIVKKERVKYESVGNQTVAYFLKVGRDTVLVVNNHLETVGLSIEEKAKFKQLVKGDLNKDTAEETSKSLVLKLAESTTKRAPEADAVAKYIAEHEGMPTIVCGDFNDSPISYVHRTIANGLTDCYIATGNGPGISYHQSGFFVRIDNIMCSSHYEPYKCYVDNKIDKSDHYPIICWLKRRAKP